MDGAPGDPQDLQATIARLTAQLQAREHELASARDQQAATAEVLRVIASSPTELQAALDAICASASRVCGATSTTIRFIEGEQLRIVARYGPSSRGEIIALDR